MSLKIAVIIMLMALIVMSQSRKAIQSKNFCNINSNGCMVGKDNLTESECDDPEDCHGMHSYQCDNLRCAVNKTECNEFLKIKKIIDFKSYKIDDHQKQNFKRFFESIGNCAPKPYDLKENHICLKKYKICYKAVKDNSFFFNLRSNKKPTMDRKQCTCLETSHPYECNENYCALDKRSCKKLNRIESMQPKKELKINHCEYN